MASKVPEHADEAFWRDYLENPNSLQSAGRRYFSKIPSNPRCRLCGSPFAGVGGSLMRLMGKVQSTANPNTCNSCYTVMAKHHGGAEVSGTMLFADIRGSTALAERMSPGEFRELLDRFYAVGTGAVFAHDGMLDKFVGDELVAMFPPLLAGERHVARAIECAVAILRATGHGSAEGPWAPIGAGVHTGKVWFGAVGVADHTELTAVGDNVNITARLAQSAGPGEVLVTAEAAAAAGLDPALERTSLALKGKEEPVEVVTLTVETPLGTDA